MTTLGIHTDAAARRIRLVGELDQASAPELVLALAGMVDGHPELELDVTELTFMDSTGLHILIHAARSLGESGTLVLRSPTSAVARLLELSGVEEHIPNLKVLHANGGESRDQ